MEKRVAMMERDLYARMSELERNFDVLAGSVHAGRPVAAEGDGFDSAQDNEQDIDGGESLELP